MKSVQQENNQQFQIEVLTQKLIEMLMEDENLTMEQAMDTVYNSHTYEKIENPNTGLFYQGAVYVMELLQEELKHQKLSTINCQLSTKQ